MTNWSELSLFVGAVSASIASLVIAIQKSKCTVIECGCVHCLRDVNPPPPPEEDPEVPEGASRDQPLKLNQLEANLRRV